MYTIHFSELLQSKNSFHPLQMNRFKWMVESVMHNVTHFGRGAVLDLEILWHLDSCLTDWNSADKNFLSWSSSSPLSSYSIPLRISESTKGIYPFEFDQKNLPGRLGNVINLAARFACLTGQVMTVSWPRWPSPGTLSIPMIISPLHKQSNTYV